MRWIIKIILNILWKSYTQDPNVIYATKPIGGAVFTAEGFLLWLRGKHPLRKKSRVWCQI